ncbi:MAG: GNAT family N-acetyltransferase [Caulobacterales bacterium]
MHLTHAHRDDRHVRLEPLTPARVPALIAAADQDPTIFAHWPRRFPSSYASEAEWLLAEQAAGRWLVHVVISPAGTVVGQTCYLNIRPEHAGTEIGGTWYTRAAQGTTINPASKRLLLAHAFAAGAERVELKTDALNVRSRAAILKLGATFEGIFRHHMIRPDGSWRDTAWYSILAADWPAVRTALDQRLAASVSTS